MVEMIWHKAASPPHMDSSIAFARWRQCAPLSNACLLGPPESTSQTASRSVQPFLQATRLRFDWILIAESKLPRAKVVGNTQGDSDFSYPYLCRLFSGASSENCLLLWHHFLSKTVIVRHFVKSAVLILFQWRDKSSPLNSTRYAVLPRNIEIVLWPQITVMSFLHPMYSTMTRFDSYGNNGPVFRGSSVRLCK